ncbi:30S ribosomal protein S16 [Bacteroidota bacterium]
MPAKIRLQRRGKKGQPFYHIVIADGRAPRDGRFIEKIGFYNPLTKPAEIEINFESALNWLRKGAQPTDTVKAILAYKGVMYKNHLLKGVQKGAFSAEEAEERFQTWLTDKEARIRSKKNEHELTLKEAGKAALDHEKKVNETKAQALAKKYAKEQKAAEAGAEAEVVADEAAASTEANEAKEEPVAETAEPVVEAVAEEAAPAADVAEVKEEPVAEAAEPVAEAAAEEAAPAADVAEVKEEPVAEAAAEEPVAETAAAEETAVEEESTPEEPKKEESAE